ncbi:MAG: pyridoxal phosphate-dependent aminotransferase, partial [Pseudomonadota bacterium]
IATEHGLSALASATNFLAIDCGKDRAFAAAVLDAVLARGVFIRKPGIAPLDRCIRVTVGTDTDLSAFAAALGPALEDAEVSASRHAAE